MVSKKFKFNGPPLAYSWYYITVVIIALIGLVDSVYLSLSHYWSHVDIGYQSFCAISRAFNCDTVSQSPYSIFLNVPVPIWGIVGYGFFLFLLVFAWHPFADRKRVWTLMLIISAAFAVYSAVLAFWSSYLIRSYCIMCILSYGVNLSLLFYAWIIRKRFACERFYKAIKLDFFYLLKFRKISCPVTSVFAAIAISMILFFPPYWVTESPALTKETTTGITQDGHPWIGAENPELTIVEFSDYRCSQCKKMHYLLRRYIQANPGKIRLVHRHFPMDHTVNPVVDQPFHRGAAYLSIFSLFAAEKGKFWKVNDILFEIPQQVEKINLKELCERAGIPYEESKSAFQNQHLWSKLKDDIRSGVEFGLTGTPGFVIGNEVYLGHIPPEIMRKYEKWH